MKSFAQSVLILSLYLFSYAKSENLREVMHFRIDSSGQSFEATTTVKSRTLIDYQARRDAFKGLREASVSAKQTRSKTRELQSPAALDGKKATKSSKSASSPSTTTNFTIASSTKSPSTSRSSTKSPSTASTKSPSNNSESSADLVQDDLDFSTFGSLSSSAYEKISAKSISLGLLATVCYLMF